IENSCQDVVSGLGFRLSSSLRFFSATSSGVISENLYVKAGTLVTLLSYVTFMMIHSVGHTVVHRPQHMHLAISISNRAAWSSFLVPSEVIPMSSTALIASFS